MNNIKESISTLAEAAYMKTKYHKPLGRKMWHAAYFAAFKDIEEELAILRATIARQAQTITDQEATTAIAFAQWVLNNTYGRQVGEVSALYDEFIKAR